MTIVGPKLCRRQTHQCIKYPYLKFLVRGKAKKGSDTHIQSSTSLTRYYKKLIRIKRLVYVLSGHYITPWT